jgi:hypothetical protein
MRDGVARVWALSESERMPLRRAALITSIRQVADALSARGFYP